MANKIRIGIIGLGMVGEPLRKWFEELNGHKRGKDLFCYDADPQKSYKDDVNKTDVVFVSVPTPPNPDGSCNTSIVESVVSQIKDDKIIVVKSTVEPGTVQRLQDKYPKKRFIFNPEFLTESQSWEDFISPDRQIVSTTPRSETDAVEVLNLLPRKNFIRPWTSDYSKKSVNTTEAEMGKYASNVFGFIKVAYGNILADLCHAMTLKYASEKSQLPKGSRGSSIKSGKTITVNYDNIKDLLAADLRIGPSWLNVNHGNYSGAGGYCLAPNERLLVFNSNKPKITFAKDLNANVVSVLGWNKGRVIKDKVTIIAKRLASSLIEFSLNKGRSISVTPDHIMIVSDKNGNLIQKCAKDVSPNDHIPVVLDGLRLKSNSTIKIHEFIDSNKERVLVGKVPQKYAGELKLHLTKNEYRDFKRTRWNAIPIQACLAMNINIDNLRIKTGTSGTWIPASIKVDGNFARLIGYYLSEGCVTDNRAVFCFGVKEHDLIDDLSGILKGLGIKYSTKVRQWKGNDSSYALKISSKVFSSFLIQTCGTNSYNKQIPYFLLESDRETKDNLLAGLFRGDGCIEKSNQGDYYNVNYATVSQILAEGADFLLREKGILSSIKKIHTAKTKVDAWSINVSESENVKKLLSLFTERQRSKVSMGYLNRKRSIVSPAYIRFKNLALLPIKEIKQLVKPTEVYSLETSRHWYMASWGILTHNCFPKDMAAFISFADSLAEQLSKKKVDPAFMKVLKKGIGVLKATEDYNVELLKAQGLNVDDVSKHNKEIIIQKRKEIRK